MTLTVTNALSISATPTSAGEALSSPAAGVIRQNFASMINQLLTTQKGENALNTLSQPLPFALDASNSSATVALLPGEAGAAQLPLPGEAGGNELPYFVPVSSLPASEIQTNSTGIPSADVSTDALAMLPIALDGQPAAQSLNPRLPLTEGLTRMPNRVDGNGNIESMLRMPESSLLNGGGNPSGTTSPMVQLLGDRSSGDASINPLSAIVSTSLAAVGSSSPVAESTVATLDALLLQQQARSLTPAPDLLVPQPGNSLNAPLLSPSGNAIAPTALIDTLPVPPRHAQFDSELGHRLVWMTKNNVSFAEIRMNPPQLGPIEIRISVTQDQASVWMNAHHSVTRDALEQAIPRLREMLQDAGLTLSDTNISSNSNSSQQQGKGFSPFAQQVIDGDEDTQGLPESEVIDDTESRLAGSAVIDYFA